MTTIIAFLLVLLFLILFITVEVALLIYIRSNIGESVCKHEVDDIHEHKNIDIPQKHDFDYLNCAAPRYNGVRRNLPSESICLS